MNKQSKPTKRQMRNLKVVRWTNGQLLVANTKTGLYHCYTKPNDTTEMEKQMIYDVAVRKSGAYMNKNEITKMWRGTSSISPNATQIRL